MGQVIRRFKKRIAVHGHFSFSLRKWISQEERATLARDVCRLTQEDDQSRTVDLGGAQHLYSMLVLINIKRIQYTGHWWTNVTDVLKC